MNSNDTFKGAAYAETQGRKTLQIGHLIESFGAERVCIVSAEQGLRTIYSQLSGVRVWRADAAESGFLGSDEDSDVSWFFDKFSECWPWIKENADKPDVWLCVDGGSRILQSIQDKIWEGTNRAHQALLRDVEPKHLHPAYRPYTRHITKQLDINTQSQWIELGLVAQRMFNHFAQLRCHQYWNFWEQKTAKDQFTKGLPYRPKCPGGGSFDAIKGFFDFIWRQTPDEVEVEQDSKKRKEATCAASFDNNFENYAKVRDDWRGNIRVPRRVPNFNLARFARYVLSEPLPSGGQPDNAKEQ